MGRIVHMKTKKSLLVLFSDALGSPLPLLLQHSLRRLRWRLRKCAWLTGSPLAPRNRVNELLCFGIVGRRCSWGFDAVFDDCIKMGREGMATGVDVDGG